MTYAERQKIFQTLCCDAAGHVHLGPVLYIYKIGGGGGGGDSIFIQLWLNKSNDFIFISLLKVVNYC